MHVRCKLDPMMQPRDEYTGRLEQRRASYASHQQQHIRIGQLRLAIFVMAAGIACSAYHDDVLSGVVAAAPLVLFLGGAHGISGSCGAWSARNAPSCSTNAPSTDWTASGRDRVRRAGASAGAQHPYADDLDVFVPGGLFQLLSSARTRAGENTLASWLMRPAGIDTLRARHGSGGGTARQD